MQKKSQKPTTPLLGRTRVPTTSVTPPQAENGLRDNYERQYPNDPEKVQQLLNQSERYEGF